jgi:hypothetical protein
VPGFAQVVDAALVTPPADVLDDVAFEVAELVGCDEVPGLDGLGLVVLAADLDVVGSFGFWFSD